MFFNRKIKYILVYMYINYIYIFIFEWNLFLGIPYVEILDPPIPHAKLSREPNVSWKAVMLYKNDVTFDHHNGELRFVKAQSRGG
jgi:hypothetical protein